MLLPCRSSLTWAQPETYPKNVYEGLHYANGEVSEANDFVGQGRIVKDGKKTNQSLCPGDSGGPVYFDPAPNDPTAGSKEIIGVNSFLSFETKTEGNFTIVTTNSELGEWVGKILKGDGKVKSFPHRWRQ